MGYDRSSDWTCRCCNGVIVPMVTFHRRAVPPLKASLRRPATPALQAASGPEDNTSVETNLPARSTIPSEIEVERQSRFNDLRRLDDRAKLVIGGSPLRPYS